MSKLMTIQQMVEDVLRQYPGTRSDDRELIQTLYGKYYEIDYYMPFGAVLRNRSLPSFESIRRARQRLQEHDESLRGDRASEEARLQKQVEYLNYARGEES